MKNSQQETRNKRIARAAVFAAILILLQSVALLGQRNPGGGSRQVVLWEWEDSGKRPLAPSHHQAIVDALYAIATRAGVVVCFDRGYRSTDPAFQEICLRDAIKKSKIQGLRWNADVEIHSQDSRRVVIVTLSMDVHGKKRRKKAQHLPAAKNLITQAEVFSPPGHSPAEREQLVAESIYEMVRSSREIYDWFKSMEAFPALLLERPAGEFPLPANRPATGEIAPATSDHGLSVAKLRRWEEAKEEIADLLIEGEAVKAKQRAEALLREKGLPDDVARRVEELRGKAEEKIAEAQAPLAPAPQPPLLDVTFPVRLAQPGYGFRSGIDGRLRISSQDICFTPNDSGNRDGWSVKWSSLKRAGQAEGLWDVAHPLVIETKEGRKYYITEITKKGGYGTGKQILEYIEKGTQIR